MGSTYLELEDVQVPTFLHVAQLVLELPYLQSFRGVRVIWEEQVNPLQGSWPRLRGRNVGPDVIHLESCTPGQRWAGLLLKRLPNIPLDEAARLCELLHALDERLLDVETFQIAPSCVDPVSDPLEDERRNQGQW